MSGDDLVPEVVTKMLGVEPTTSYAKGDQSPRGVQYWKSGGWIIHSGERRLSDDDDGSRQLEEWLAALPADQHVWRHLQERYEVWLRLVLYTHQMNAEFYLSPGAASELAKRGLTLMIDPYVIPDDSEED